MDDLARDSLQGWIQIDSLKTYSWAFVIASVTVAFLQELVFSLKGRYRKGQLKNGYLHMGLSGLGMGAAAYGLFINPFGERYLVVGIAAVFWILFRVKKSRRKRE